MARRRQTDNPNIWPLTEHVNGYIFDRNGVATIRFADHYKSTGMPFDRRNRRRAIAMGNRWVWDLKERQSGIASVEPPQPVSVHEAIAEFKVAKLQRAPAQSSKEYDQMWAAWFPTNIVLGDDLLLRHLVVMLPKLEKRYHPNTLVRHTDKLTKFLDYCIGRRWLTVNPFTHHLVDPPTRQRKSETRIYTSSELADIQAYFADRVEKERALIDPRNRNAQQYVLLWPFLRLSFLRIGEALSLRWAEDVTDHRSQNYIADSEIVINTSKTSKRRSFPYRQFPELVEVIDQLRTYREVNRGYVFKWRNSQTPAKALGRALEAKGIEKPKRPVHTFRATGEEQMRAAGHSEAIIAQLAGHSLPVFERDYSVAQKAETLAAKLQRERRSIDGAGPKIE